MTALAASSFWCVACSQRGALFRSNAELSHQAVKQGGGLTAPVRCGLEPVVDCCSHRRCTSAVNWRRTELGRCAHSWSVWTAAQCWCEGPSDKPAAPAWPWRHLPRCATAAPRCLRTCHAVPSTARLLPARLMSAGPPPRAGSAQPMPIVRVETHSRTHMTVAALAMQCLHDQRLSVKTAEGTA